jgi:hypothetical protein
MGATPLPSAGEQRLLAVLALLTALASVYVMRNADADLWGNLRCGRLLVENGGQIADDPFAFTTADRRWCNHEYLAQMLLWLAYAAGGPVGLIVLKCALGGAAVYCLYAAVRLGSADARVWAPVLMLAAHTLGRWFLFRPQLFTFLLFAWFVLTLLRHLMARRARLWLLPVLVVLWVNLHGGFLAGLGAVGLALLLRAAQAYNVAGLRRQTLCRATWPLGLTLLACLAASLCNPLGWRLWPYLATELGFEPNRRYIDEWQPVRFDAPDWSACTLAALLALLAAAGLLAARRKDLLYGLRSWQWLLSCLPLAFLATRSVRHIPIFTLWAAPVLALLAQAAQEAWGEKPLWRCSRLLTTGLISAVGMLTVFFALSHPAAVIRTDGPVLGPRSPRGAVAFLRANGVHGRVFTPLWWGSYLTWELHPAVQVSIDGRNVTLFAGEQVEANLSFYLDANPDPETPVRTAADFLLIPTDAAVLGRVRADPRWAVLFEDAGAVLLVRADEAHADWLRRRRAGELTAPDVEASAVFQ